MDVQSANSFPLSQLSPVSSKSHVTRFQTDQDNLVLLRRAAHFAHYANADESGEEDNLHTGGNEVPCLRASTSDVYQEIFLAAELL